MTYGYEGDIVFPFKVFRSIDEDLSKISVDVDFLICADICIPEQASLTLDLTSTNPDPLLDIAIKNLPTGFIQTHSTLNGDQLQVTFKSSKPLSTAYLFPRENNLFVYIPKHDFIQLNENTYQISLPILKSNFESFSGVLSLDGEGLKAEGREEKANLLEELKEFLESVSLSERARQESEQAEAQQSVLNKAPLPIYIG